MDSVKYIGMDVHKETISIAVLNSSGKLIMECTIETKRPSQENQASAVAVHPYFYISTARSVVSRLRPCPASTFP
jgi:hypothetical protein